MKTHRNDLTIDEAMADPLIRTVMRADGVEPRQLEAMLRNIVAAGPSRRPGGVDSPTLSARPSPSFFGCGASCS